MPGERQAQCAHAQICGARWCEWPGLPGRIEVRVRADGRTVGRCGGLAKSGLRPSEAKRRSLRENAHSGCAWKVSQLAVCPDFNLVRNQRVRCPDDPRVKASGTR